MTTAEQKIEAIKRSIRNLRRIERDIQTEDYEALDALSRTLSDLDSDLFDLELSLQHATDDIAAAA